MSFIKTQRRFIWLIIGSLSLLGIFLFYWLFSVWDGFYRNAVDKEAEYLLQKMFPYVFFALLLFVIPAVVFAVLLRGLQREYRHGQIRNDFISSISHELRSPIATIRVALEGLQEGEVDEAIKSEYLKVSVTELDRLTLMVDKVLRLSVFEQRDPGLAPEPVDLAPVVRGVFRSMHLNARAQGAELTCDFPEHSAYWVEGDPVHLSNVVYNLVDNAIKYNQNKPGILARLSSLPGIIRLEIIDNGVGVPVSLREKIFEKYYRAPQDKRIKARGQGIGLSYVKRVVTLHGGHIGVTDNQGGGSVFTIDLPAISPPDSGDLSQTKP